MGEREMVSADEARAMLDGVREGDWTSVALEGDRFEIVGEDGAHIAEVEDDVGDDEYLASDNADLIAAAPRLARTVVAQAGRIAALEAIIEGRATPPTDVELAAHDGAWLMRLYNGALVVMRSDGAREARGVMVRDVPYVAHWIATTSDGRPCAWPVASQRPAGCICDFRDGKHRFSCLRQQPTVAVARGEDGAFRVAGTEVDRGK